MTGVPAYFVEGIFGLGEQPGHCCVVSDFKIKELVPDAYMQSIRNLIFHEVGHNKGLQHCSKSGCLMSEQGSVAMLINSGNFCEACRSK